MTRKRANNLTPGAVVIVYSFGRHVGDYIGPSHMSRDWVHIRLHDGRDWHGTPRDVDVATVKNLADRLRYIAERAA